MRRGLPQAITVDNGTECISKVLDEWACRRGVKLDYTRPGKPADNGRRFSAPLGWKPEKVAKAVGPRFGPGSEKDKGA